MSAVGSNPSSFQEGNEVTVLYNPNKPNNASIKDFFSLWLLPFVLMFLGVGFTMLGIVLLLMISILPQRRKKYLLKRGQKIITDFMGLR